MLGTSPGSFDGRSLSIAGATLLTAVALPQGEIDAFDQYRVIKGLAQEANRPGGERPCPDAFFGEGGDEDDGDLASLRDQRTLQLDARHTRHLNVCYYT